MKIIKKLATISASMGVLVVGFAGVASAHVVVKPGDVKTATYQTFVLGAPTERNSPTVRVKLQIPKGVTSVTPTVKPGWTIKTTKQGKGDDAVVTSITWTGGKIAKGLRDEFTFSAKTPDQPTNLQWKAYQTYGDGTVVSWNQPPSGEEKEDSKTGPFSVTKVVTESDQDVALKNADAKAQSAQTTASNAFYTAIGGIVLAFIAIVIFVIPRSKP